MLRVAVLGLIACSLLAAPGQASQRLAVDPGVVSLQVNARAEALVTYEQASGSRRSVVVRGAVNARPPEASRPQVRFDLDYSGRGARSFRNLERPAPGARGLAELQACSGTTPPPTARSTPSSTGSSAWPTPPAVASAEA